MEDKLRQLLNVYYDSLCWCGSYYLYNFLPILLHYFWKQITYETEAIIETIFYSFLEFITRNRLIASFTGFVITKKKIDPTKCNRKLQNKLKVHNI